MLDGKWEGLEPENDRPMWVKEEPVLYVTSDLQMHWKREGGLQLNDYYKGVRCYPIQWYMQVVWVQDMYFYTRLNFWKGGIIYPLYQG